MSKKPYSKIIFYLWGLVILGIFAVMALVYLLSISKLPDTQELENPKYEFSSVVYTNNMEELGRYFKKNRDLITFNELNKNVVNALLATEDIRFFDHSGIDAKGTLRAVAYLGNKGGASTITQQLAKLFFTNRSSNFVKRVWQKLQEWIIATEFEKKYTKEEILSMYLNKYDFIYDSHGIGAASKTYFGKNQKDLSISESAMLVGMLKNAVLYNPKLHPESALGRRNIVLNQMHKYEFIDKDTYELEKESSLNMSNFKRTIHSDGPAPYFRAETTKWLKNLLKDDKYKKADGTSYDIYTDGLKIYTTIDMKMQKHAEEAMEQHMKKIQKKYFRVWKNKDPWTYEADTIQLKIRQKSLDKLIRETDRYKNLRGKYLSDIATTITSEIDNLKMRDSDIKRLIREDKKAGYLAQLVKKKWISKKMSIAYKKLLKSTHKKELFSQWEKLQKAVDKDFSKPVKMTVFAYNDKHEKEVTISPLDSIKYYRQHMQFGSLIIEPHTGEVKAWVGGINFKHFQYDHTASRRQVGSTFKPFIYTSAIMQGISPCQKVQDIQYSIPAHGPDFNLTESWSPGNASEFSHKYYTLFEGLKESKNSVSVWLMKQLGDVEFVRNLASNMGIDKSRIPPSPSICLGTAELSLQDMAGAYTTFANDGVYTKPIWIRKIEDKNGKVIYNAEPEQKQVLQEKYNYVMREMLYNAVKHHAGQMKTQFGGKTGTTNDFVDGWFMGVTPNLIVGTWVGGDANWIRFLSLANGQGAIMARPFFFDFMKRLEKDPPSDFKVGARFKTMDNIGIEIDCSKYTKMEKEENARIEELKKQDATSDEMEEELDEELDNELEELDEDDL